MCTTVLCILGQFEQWNCRFEFHVRDGVYVHSFVNDDVSKEPFFVKSVLNLDRSENQCSVHPFGILSGKI
jgi:hypothetical protein